MPDCFLESFLVTFVEPAANPCLCRFPVRLARRTTERRGQSASGCTLTEGDRSMTTRPTAQVLRDAYQAAGHGDLQPLLGTLREDVTWADSTLGPLAGTYTKDEVPQFFAKMMDIYGRTLWLEIVSIVADDNHAAVLTRESGTVRGETATWTGVHVWSFEQGRATRFVSYASAEYQRFWARKGTTVTG